MGIASGRPSSTRTRLVYSATLFALSACLLLCVHTAIASAYEYKLTMQFGAKGEAAGQMQEPRGLAVDDSTHDVYVADTKNDRVDKFASDGKFIAAWGWGVADGVAKEEVCTSVCLAGLSGTGNGQFESPIAVAVDNSNGSSRGDVYVADFDGKRVDKFTSSGEYLWERSAAYSLEGVSVDSAGRVWIYDAANEVHEFSSEDEILQEWSTEAAPGVGLAVDDNDNVYTIRPCGCLEKFSQSGESLGEVAPSARSAAIAVNQIDNTLFSVYESTVYKYRPSKTQPSPLLTSFESKSLVQADGVAVDPGREDVYVASGSNDEIYVFGPPPPGPPQIEGVSASKVFSTSATVAAQVYSGQFDATYQIEYGPTEAYGGTIPITPKDIGSGVREVVAEQILEGLSPETTYHYRLSAANSQGTVRSVDHTFTTFSLQGSTLPDGRVYELVSPPNKNDGDVGVGKTVEGQAAVDGSAVKYVSAGVFSGSQNGGFSEYLSRRSSDGWHTQGLDPPAPIVREASLEASSQAFSTDLSKEVLVWDFGSLTPEAPGEQHNIYLGNTSDGTYRLLAPGRLNEGRDPQFVGASTSFEDVAFDFGGVLTKDAAPEGNNVYEWHNGVLSLVSVLPGQTEGATGATGGGGEGEGETQNAVSTDGRRVFWSDSQQLYVYEGAAGSVKVNASQRTPSLGDGNAQFMGATADGRLVFFKDTVALTDQIGDNGGLYEFDTENGALTDLTPDEAEAPFVSGVVGYADDGSYVYFVAEHPLAAGAATHAPNLYVTHGGQISFIATLIGSVDSSDWSSRPKSRTAEVTPNGVDLVFVSSASLTGYDNTEPSGKPASEVFEYDARKGKLHCMSCNPTGTAPVGASTVSTWTTPSYDTHYVSNDGSRVFFDSEDVLAAHDTDGLEDVYEWERDGAGGCALASGCVYLISSGTSEDVSQFVAAGEDGNDVFFVTRSALVPEDGDEKIDMYDARVNGGFPAASNELAACEGEGCLGPLGAAPASLTPLTSVTTPSALAGARPELGVAGMGNAGLARLGRTGRLTVGVTVAGGGRAWAKVTARLDGRVRVIASTSARVSDAGRVKLKLQLDKAARQALARRRRLGVTIAIGCSGARTRQIVATLRSGR